MKGSVRLAYRSGLKMATLGCKENRSTRKISKKLEVSLSLVSGVLKSFQASPDPTSWLADTRMAKSCKLSDESRNIIRNFWHEKSRPTGDKRDIARQRMGLKNYIEHPKQILEKTQTELYLDFCKSETGVKFSQRVSKKEKPFYVKTASRSDRNRAACAGNILKFIKCLKILQD